jgi:hypothetical protein
MYKIFMIVSVIVVGGGWIAYAIYDYKMRQIEKNEPKKGSVRLEKTKSEMSDWAKKMAAYKKPEFKRPKQDDQTDNE